MKKFLSLLGALAVYGLSMTFVAAQSTITDSFEGTTLDPSWFTVLNHGSIFPSTSQAHSGTQSVQLNTSAFPGDSVEMHQNLNTPGYGQVSVWLYDSGAGLSQAANVNFFVGNNTTAWSLLGSPAFATYQYVLGSSGFHDTGIGRTQGWHQFSAESIPGLLALAVDGTLVYSSSDGQPFSYSGFRMWGAPWQSNWDDFTLTAVPEPSTTILFALGAAAGVFVRVFRKSRQID
jgi:hypothetical protein